MTTFTLSEKKQSLYSDWHCQFLLPQKFYEILREMTYFADHTDEWSHDQLRSLSEKSKTFLQVNSKGIR